MRLFGVINTFSIKAPYKGLIKWLHMELICSGTDGHSPLVLILTTLPLTNKEILRQGDRLLVLDLPGIDTKLTHTQVPLKGVQEISISTSLASLHMTNNQRNLIWASIAYPPPQFSHPVSGWRRIGSIGSCGEYLMG